MNHGYPRPIIALMLCVPLAGCHHGQAAAPPPAIDWHTSVLDLNLRGMNGKTYVFRCPAGRPVPEAVTGSGVYTDASSICTAAAHAGQIDAAAGGPVMIQILPGQSDYRGSTQNFIHSTDYAQAWGGSFAVLSAADFNSGQRR